MSNKSEAAWHPNSGPMTDHTDLIARLRTQADYQREVGPGRGIMLAAADALADSVPRGLYTHAVAVHEEGNAAVASAERERDEARSAITGALAILGDRIPLGASVVRALDRRLADVRDALMGTPSMSVTLHDAEVKAQALDEAVADLLEQFPTYGTNGTTAGWLLERAAAIRAETNDHSN